MSYLYTKNIKKHKIKIVDNTLDTNKKLGLHLKNIAKDIYLLPSFIDGGLELWQIAEYLKDPLVVMVTGVFSSGKSSFINTLLKENILVIGDLPTTAIITKISYGKKRRIVTHYSNGKEKESSLSNANLVDITSEEEGSTSLREEIAFVEIFLPNKLLKNITLIDTPGVNSLYDRHEDLTKHLIEEIDVIFFISAATQATSQKELDLLGKIQVSTPIYFIINKIDTIDEEEEDPDEFVNDCHKKLKSKVTKTFGFSSKQPLDKFQKVYLDRFLMFLEDDIFKNKETLKTHAINRKLFEYNKKSIEKIAQKQAENQQLAIGVDAHNTNLQLLYDKINGIDDIINTINSFKYINIKVDDVFPEWYEHYENFDEWFPAIMYCYRLLENNSVSSVYNNENFSSWFAEQTRIMNTLLSKRTYIYRRIDNIRAKESSLLLAEKDFQEKHTIYSNSGLFGGEPVFDFSGKRATMEAARDYYNMLYTDYDNACKSISRDSRNVVSNMQNLDVNVIARLKNSISKLKKLKKKEWKNVEKLDKISKFIGKNLEYHMAQESFFRTIHSQLDIFQKQFFDSGYELSDDILVLLQYKPIPKLIDPNKKSWFEENKMRVGILFLIVINFVLIYVLIYLYYL